MDYKSPEKIEILVKDGTAPYLKVVLCKWGEQFVTWCKNTDLGGYHHGHYFFNLQDALDDFNERE